MLEVDAISATEASADAVNTHLCSGGEGGGGEGGEEGGQAITTMAARRGALYLRGVSLSKADVFVDHTPKPPAESLKKSL